MSIVYHGDDYGTTKLDPRWMLHQQSINSYGIGIYFHYNYERALGYGPKVCSINTDRLHIIQYDAPLYNISSSKREKFIRYLHKTKSWSKFSIRKKDKKMKFNRPWILDLYNLFSEKFLNEKLFEKCIEYNHIAIYEWQIFLAILYGFENIVEFVHGWNKIIQIDGLIEEMKTKVAIIQTKVKVTPVNF